MAKKRKKKSKIETIIVKKPKVNRYPVVGEYLQGNFKKFITRLSKFWDDDLIYSCLLDEWDLKKPGIKKSILKLFKGRYPNETCQALKVHRVMMKYYGFDLNLEHIVVSHRISEQLDIRITDYFYNKYRDMVLIDKKSPPICNPKQARRELKARGFVRIDRFTNFDKRRGHITSNMQIHNSKVTLYWPGNFFFGITPDLKDRHWWDIPGVYTMNSAVGLRGYTRVSYRVSK